MPADSFTSVPNLLSLSRIPLGIVLFVLIDHQLWLAGLLVFLVAVLTDWLDGWWARRYNMISLIGRNLDPLTDKFLICGTYIYFQTANVGVMPWMVTVIVGREILITGIRGIVEATGKKFGADWKIENNFTMCLNYCDFDTTNTTCQLNSGLRHSRSLATKHREHINTSHANGYDWQRNTISHQSRKTI
jgi:phosphatidylglycerophosphate synthase